MSWSPSSPLTGAAQASFTSPTYTLTSDFPPAPNCKQYAITALGGTQNSATSTGAATPFTLSFWKPTVLKTVKLDADGKAIAAPVNTYKIITRKSVNVDSLASPRIAIVTTTIEVPAGAEVNDGDNIRAMLSCHFGALWDQSSGIGSTVRTGVV